jgi:hypothetical protein
LIQSPRNQKEQAVSITVAKFLDVADGTQPGQFTIGERGPFHAHTRRYFWTVVDGGIARQRAADGTMITREYHVGDTNYSEHSPDEPLIHDLENVGESQIRFVTVELLD